MAWQDVFPVSSPRIDAEEERELRLAAQASAGAEWALTALIARYQPPVTRYLTRLTGNPERARALAERIFVRMERRIHGPHGGRYLRLWLLRSCTEGGLDALRKPRRGAVPPRLGAPLRPLALLDAPGVAPHIERLRAGIGAIAGVTGQTSRQVRKLIWRDRDLPPATPREARDVPQGDEADKAGDGGEPDAREALRYRMIRAILAELPYGDAQCLALHLVAGLNQAEVARALGLTNSATRRRIVLGLQLFSQRYEAAVAALGLSPEMLAAIQPDARRDPLAPGVGGYVPYQEQPTNAYPAVTVSPEPPSVEAGLLEPVAAGPTNWLPREDSSARPPASFSFRTDSVLEGAIVDAMPSQAETTEAHPLILAESMLITADTTPLPPQDAPPVALADPWSRPLAGPGEGRAFDADDGVALDDGGPTLPRMAAVRPLPGKTDEAEAEATPAPMVPVLSPPRPRERSETVPLRGRGRLLSDLPAGGAPENQMHPE
jgi:DNA-directed RNA polymerase specialized sigma24 family protein